MTSRERAKLKNQAIGLESIFQIGKTGITPQQIDAIRAALKTRELIKINVLKNCDSDISWLAKMLSERTGAQIVQVIGRKIVLYKKNPMIEEKKVLAEKREQKRILRKKEYIKKKIKEQRNNKKRKDDTVKIKNTKFIKDRKWG